MASPPPGLEEKVYAVAEGHMLSVRDLLDYFKQRGSLRVSDLHLKQGSPPTYRVDGRLTRIKGAPLNEASVSKIARIMLSDEDWHTLEVERSVDSSIGSGEMLFRLNIFHEADGLALAIRALDTNPPDVETVGFPNKCWEDIVRLEHGLVLVTGITGAGKSTTIASLISRIARQDPCRIITLEDPIEYQLQGHAAMISQREVGRDVLSYERGLRDCLREDPDVIFVGEMRDRDSASWTLTAAETGHLVFSTLHTRDVRGTLTRLLDMFPAERQDEIANQMSLGLAYIVCQKLLPRADGNGRVVAMEILNNSYATANIIRTRKIEQLYSILQTKIRDLQPERMTTLERSLAQLVNDNTVSLEDAMAFANHPQELISQIRHFQAVAAGELGE
jgi:twitching motility protein PilT